ncbi:MAG: hypothetical protein JHC52_11405 [Chthoniobacterales bacterium]|nr:hypothetical protein [Chthoniobacterales bacterium]
MALRLFAAWRAQRPGPGQTKARGAWSEVVSSCMTLGAVRGERGGNNTFNVKLS